MDLRSPGCQAKASVVLMYHPSSDREEKANVDLINTRIQEGHQPQRSQKPITKSLYG